MPGKSIPFPASPDGGPIIETNPFYGQTEAHGYGTTEGQPDQNSGYDILHRNVPHPTKAQLREVEKY